MLYPYFVSCPIKLCCYKHEVQILSKNTLKLRNDFEKI
ncbi:hypothetical protein HFN_2163 [Helicobacter fennelliae MRY12-0050]|uniref:Uncharacterized protein n=1 Tax=Helicobacter fennelliae MRY12-0050 TaxID=1325130 RepID=T1D0L0_9HELI|nr:hypothetical protein HFN_2163 [Helicobacter fennelliae MRY12-0050]